MRNVIKSSSRVLESAPVITVRKRQTLRLGEHTATFITFDGLSHHQQHFAIGYGEWDSSVVPLVRMHSECVTGDVFGSQHCDCGPQLKDATRRLQSEGGLLLYLRQEGRGIGLNAKIDAYSLQALGMDTFEANRALGFPEDARDFGVAAQMLLALGKKRIRLLSNNPDKKNQLLQSGIEVLASVPTGAFLTADNSRYLTSKQQHGHTVFHQGV